MKSDDSLLGNIGNQLSDAWKILIRPSQPPYQISDLGPPMQVIANCKYTRRDFTYCNKFSSLLQCSLFYPEEVIIDESTATGGSNSYDDYNTSGFANQNSMDNKLFSGQNPKRATYGFERCTNKPCLIYLHSQSGNRVEGLHL